MWPFNTKETAPPLRPAVIQDAMDELGLVKANELNRAIEIAMLKHLDPSNLDEAMDDRSGYFQPEFELVATAGRMKSVYRREPWVYTTASLIAKTLATVPFDVKNKQTGEIDPNHPMNEILRAGNDIQDKFSKDWAGSLDLVLGGNFFEVIDGDQVLHVPVELVTLKIAESPEERKKYGPILGIEVLGSVRGGSPYSEPRFIEWKDVIHHKLPNPFSPFVGMSMIAAASRPILLDRHKNEFEMAFYLRGATHSGVIETTEDITKARMERLMRTFESAFTGRRNWFRQLFLPKGAKWVNSGLTMSEMQHLEGLRENRLTLLAVLGVPPMKVGIVQDVNRSTSEVQDKTFWENTIIPLARMRAAGWNKSHLVKRIYKGEVEICPNFDGIEAVEGGILTRAEQAKSLENIATINEQRSIAGLPPLKATDPRGNMFTVELIKSAMPDPFGAVGTPPRPEDLGPDDQPVGDVREIELGPGDGDYEHTHMAEVDELGNGYTTSTDGDSEPHDHEILAGDVQVGGADGHSHPPVEMTEVVPEEERTFRRVKAAAVSSQELIESSQGGKYLKGFDHYLELKFSQIVRGLKEGVDDLRSYLVQGLPLRTRQYQADGLKVLVETMDRGFAFGLTQTRHFSKVSKKAFTFSPTDELAIEILKSRTEGDRRRVLEQRGIEHFLGFDASQTEAIMKLVEKGQKEGRTLEQIAKTIEKEYGENYRDQAFTIARTETLFAISQGLNWQHDTLKQVFSEVHKQWFHVGDVGTNPDARAEHAEFENAGDKGVVPSDYVWVNPSTGAHLSFPRDPQAGASDVINCRCTMVSVIPKNAQSNADQIINRG